MEIVEGKKTNFRQNKALRKRWSSPTCFYNLKNKYEQSPLSTQKIKCLKIVEEKKTTKFRQNKALGNGTLPIHPSVPSLNGEHGLKLDRWCSTTYSGYTHFCLQRESNCMASTHPFTATEKRLMASVDCLHVLTSFSLLH